MCLYYLISIITFFPLQKSFKQFSVINFSFRLFSVNALLQYIKHCLCSTSSLFFKLFFFRVEVVFSDSLQCVPLLKMSLKTWVRDISQDSSLFITCSSLNGMQKAEFQVPYTLHLLGLSLQSSHTLQFWTGSPTHWPDNLAMCLQVPSICPCPWTERNLPAGITSPKQFSVLCQSILFTRGLLQRKKLTGHSFSIKKAILLFIFCQLHPCTV